jgi:hypothetical protein
VIFKAHLSAYGIALEDVEALRFGGIGVVEFGIAAGLIGEDVVIGDGVFWIGLLIGGPFDAIGSDVVIVVHEAKVEEEVVGLFGEVVVDEEEFRAFG